MRGLSFGARVGMVRREAESGVVFKILSLWYAGRAIFDKVINDEKGTYR